jgi:hypothetical protein
LPPFVGRLGFPFETFNQGGVQVHGGNLLLRKASPDGLDPILIDLRQSTQRLALAGDITHLPHRQISLGLRDALLLVKCVQELARRLRARQLVPQHLGQALVLPQALEVFQTFPAQRIQHQKALHVGGLVEAALALLHVQVPLHPVRNTEQPHRPHEKRNARLRGQHLLGGMLKIVLEGQLTLGGRPSRFLQQSHRCQPSNFAPLG